MLRVTLLLVLLVVTLLWMISWLVIAPLDSLVIQYGDQLVVLPLVSSWAMQFSSWSGVVPLGWLILTLVASARVSRLPHEKRGEWLAGFMALGLVFGLSLLLFNLLALVLAWLKALAVEL